MFGWIKKLICNETPESVEGAKSELELKAEDMLRSGRPALLDNELSGWFKQDTGELFTGFSISAQDSVLDIGCGDAPFVSFCAQQGAALYFADIDEEKISSVKKKLTNSPARSLNPLVTDAAPLPLCNNVFTKVIAMEVLEHVDDPSVFVDELVRVGKPGAQYLITVPDSLHETVEKDLAPPSYFEKPNHIRIFMPGELESLLTKAGLEIESKSSYGFYWSLWWYFFWACEQDISDPWHPVLQSWTKTWIMLLNTDQGPEIKATLDKHMPKSRLIIARKPQAGL